MGTAVYDGFDAIAPGMAPDGWCDAGWVNIIDHSQAMMLDNIGGSNSVDVLIRAIDLHGTGQSAPTPQDSPFKCLSRDKVLLWQRLYRIERAIAAAEHKQSRAEPSPLIAPRRQMIKNDNISVANRWIGAGVGK